MELSSVCINFTLQDIN